MKEFETFAGSIRIRTRQGQFPVSMDSILLADFVRLRPGAAVLDLGCGAGVIGLLLCGRDDTCHVTGAELQEGALQLARQNILENGLEERMQLLRADLRQYKSLLPAGGFTAAVSNPPYFPAGSGAAKQENAAARMESFTLDELFACAAWSLQFGSPFFLVHRPERLTDLLCAARQSRLEPKRLRFVRHRPQQGASLVLLECRLGGKPGLAYEPDLVLFQPDGSPTCDYRRIYHI